MRLTKLNILSSQRVNFFSTEKSPLYIPNPLVVNLLVGEAALCHLRIIPECRRAIDELAQREHRVVHRGDLRPVQAHIEAQLREERDERRVFASRSWRFGENREAQAVEDLRVLLGRSSSHKLLFSVRAGLSDVTRIIDGVSWSRTRMITDPSTSS